MFKDLDEQKLVFRTNHRPRARYLYWQYCTSLLQKAWRQPKGNGNSTIALKREFGCNCWGETGLFMKKSMLKGFVEEMGHEFEELMEGAVEDGEKDNGESDSLALMASSRYISVVSSNRWEDGDEDEEDETSDEEEWDSS